MLTPTSLIRRVLTTVMLLSAVVPAAATISEQFHLNPYGRDASACWLTCNMQVTYSLPLPNNKPNAETYIDVNCGWDAYMSAMSACLPVRCSSVNDVAYALEFGHAFCKKAGKDVRVELDESYVTTVGGYFDTEDYKKWNDDYAGRSAADARFTLPVFLILGVTMATIMLCM